MTHWTQAADLEVVETHISRVYLGRDRVWKTKKPVDLGFLDFTTAEARRRACEAEVRLNRRLAPDVYLGVVPVVQGDEGLELGSLDAYPPSGSGAEAEADTEVDWAVLMRRLPDARRADRLLDRGELSRDDLRRVAERLVRFHAAARCDEETKRYGTASTVEANVRENFEQTRDVIGEYLSAEQAREVERWQLGFLEQEADLFAERIGARRVRDGHGDLRLEHVYLDLESASGQDDVVVVDCIEFNDRFRYADVCADVAFLAMDLTSRRRPDLAEAFLAAYARDAQDYDLYPLVDFYESYRAFVRAKVASMVAASDDAPPRLRRQKREEAREHFLLALSGARRQLLPPRLVAVGGWIAAGKSTTSERVSRLLDAPIVDADRTRKHLLDVDAEEKLHVKPWSGPYSEEMTERTYDEVLRRGEQVVRSGRPVVLDASFRLRRHRLDARRLARRLGVPFLFVECRADADACRERLRRRRAEDSAGASDGRLEIFDDFVAGYQEPEASSEESLDASEFLRLDTDRLSLEASEGLLRERLPSMPPQLG